jgi:nucleotide-binding universal stress UspA family protein
MYQSVLFPTDGSEQSRRARDAAFDLAETYDATLHVLYVVDTGALPLDAHARAVFARLDREARRAVAEVVTRAERREIDPVVGTVTEGRPHETILGYVADHDVDIVVMGTHGRRGVSRALLGSVTERVVRLADAPVLTVRSTEVDAGVGTAEE